LKGTLDFGLHLVGNGDGIYFTFNDHWLRMRFEHLTINIMYCSQIWEP
jgi:hypothetical protein